MWYFYTKNSIFFPDLKLPGQKRWEKGSRRAGEVWIRLWYSEPYDLDRDPDLPLFGACAPAAGVGPVEFWGHLSSTSQGSHKNSSE